MATFPALPRESVPAAAAPLGPKTSAQPRRSRVLTSLAWRPRTDETGTYAGLQTRHAQDSQTH